MKQRIIDLRGDAVTAAHVAEALQLQAAFGYEYARDYLLELGVEAQVAQHLLAIRYERRAAQISAAVAA